MMISYTLICANDHEFAEHFDSYDALQTDLKAKTMICPACGSKDLTKGLSAPNVASQHPAPALPNCPAAAGCGNGGCAFKG